MKTALYALLLALALWAGFALREAQVPAPVAQEPAEVGVEETETIAEPTTVEAAEEAPIVAEPGPLVGAPPPRSPAPEPVVYTEEYVTLLERAIHDRTNAERVREGLGILSYDDALADIAAYHSTDMAQKDYFAHEDENGCASPCRATDAGYPWRSIGENLFFLHSVYRYTVEDASAVIVAGWMGSDGHRANLLHGEFTREGLGVVVSGDSLYATQVFARPR